MKIYSTYLESFVDRKWHINTTFDETRFRVGKIMIAQANFIFDEPEEKFISELKDIAINGKEFNKELFTKWLRDAIKSSHLDIYYMKEHEDKTLGCKPKGSIKGYINGKLIIKIHFTYKKAPTGRLTRCDFIKELTADKISKVYDVLQAETRQEAERIWND